MKAYLTELDSFLAEFAVEPEEYVVVPVRLSGRGRESGAEFDVNEVHLFRLRDGRIIELHEYGNKEEALEAAGLSE